MLSQDQQKHLVASFKEFVSRPENAQLAEKAQQEEAEQALAAQEASNTAAFMEQVQAAGPDVCAAIEPFMRSPVLRHVIMTLANDGDRSLEYWATNPQVQALLHKAASLLSSGSMTEEQLEYLLVQQLKAPSNRASSQFKDAAQAVVAVNTEQLVSALNEQLQERAKGRQALRQGQYEEALKAYHRALAILRLVRAANPTDQDEVTANTVTTLVQLAEAQLAAKLPWKAIQSCNEAITLGGPDSSILILRARAYALRREFQAARTDLMQATVMGVHDEDQQAVTDVHELISRLQTADKQTESKLFKAMFSR